MWYINTIEYLLLVLVVVLLLSFFVLKTAFLCVATFLCGTYSIY